MSKQVAGNILIALGGILLLGSATAKLAHIPKVMMQMAAMGFGGNKLLFVALLEIASAFLFLIPLTRSFGLLLVSSYLGGAIATHLQHDQSIVPPSVVLALIWLGLWLRHREVRWSFGALKQSSIRAADATMLHKQSMVRP